VLANFDSPHAWRWTRVFVERGHEVHAISYYPPARHLPGVRLHALRPGPGPSGDRGSPSSRPGLRRRLPPSAARLANGLRFRRAGLAELLRQIAPDVFHAHFVVEHGFFAALAGFRPLVVSAWGSDLFQAPRTPIGAAIARYTLRRADLVSGNDPALVRAAVRLGAAPERTVLVRLGLDRSWLEEPPRGANLRPGSAPPTVLSDRALEPLYNVDTVLRAFAQARERVPGARLVIANDGSARGGLERLAAALGLGEAVQFVGVVGQEELMRLLDEAHVYVSVPSSDSLALSTMEAMSRGVFPVVSDLPSQDGWIEDHVTGLRVPVRDPGALARALVLALSDAGLRQRAVAANRAKVAAEGDLERNMLVMERHYYRLAGRPQALEWL
jgi:glycosyltransferase involved in cell wall biosynthesis